MNPKHPALTNHTDIELTILGIVFLLLGAAWSTAILAVS